MKKDINPPKVENVAIAIVPEEDENGEEQWFAYFLNLNESELEAVLVRSNGYGEKKGEKIKTSELRHFLNVVPPKSYMKIEPLLKEVFKLSNQYWVSYYLNHMMYDKKYVFVPESITERNFIELPLLGKKGVMIR
jgi:hypothetical protein